MAGTIRVQCNLGHWHEIDRPDDLISIADASRLVQRAISTIMKHVKTGNLIVYPTPSTFGKQNTMISRHQLLQADGLEAQAS
jgi:hypothetical protein